MRSGLYTIPLRWLTEAYVIIQFAQVMIITIIICHFVKISDDDLGKLICYAMISIASENIILIKCTQC